jgi:hypothetical protein
MFQDSLTLVITGYKLRINTLINSVFIKKMQVLQLAFHNILCILKLTKKINF